MDNDIAPKKSSSPVPPLTTVILDSGSGSRYISDSDDEDIYELLTSKNKSSLVNYERESDDEHTDEEDDNNEEQNTVDDQLNSKSADYPLIFPEDAEIRISPEPAKNYSAKLETFLPLVRKAVSGERNILQASITNVSSVMTSITLASTLPSIYFDYQCSKTALNISAVCFAETLAKSNIYIVLLHPG
ncbi:unnamed protein product [Adineta steineri]|uniref:Uncharacterized protein n=1 Tax=Adineta steineri TaxID=433720 RepID=A0A819Y440_9BILA|nr:unnamed protein product [Adineta steineri]CAF4144493.1 unnamed protein product [Adineta steineri]